MSVASLNLLTLNELVRQLIFIEEIPVIEFKWCLIHILTYTFKGKS